MIIDPRIVPDAHDAGLTLEEIADCCGCGTTRARLMLKAAGRRSQPYRRDKRDMASRRKIVDLLQNRGVADSKVIAKKIRRSVSFVNTFLRRWFEGVEVMGDGR